MKNYEEQDLFIEDDDGNLLPNPDIISYEEEYENA